MKADLRDVARALSLPEPTQSRTIEILLTDSRSLTEPETSLFFAIPTKENDGHRYVRDLYERGVRAFVVNRIPDDMHDVVDAQFLVVDDTVCALQQVAAALTPRPGQMVAIAGSRGKTTLKEWIFQLMEPLCAMVRSPRSFNSRIGVPLSLWEIGPDTQVAVIEAAVSAPGEMPPLAKTIDPDTVIFTNIISELPTSFATPQQNAAEKALLARTGRVKRMIYNADDRLMAQTLQGLDVPQTITWSRTNRSATLFIQPSPGTPGHTRIEYLWHGTPGSVEIPFTSDNDVDTAAAALAFMLSCGVDSDTVSRRFATLHAIGTRLNVSEGVNGCTLIYDAYTSDLSSLRGAIDFMNRRVTDGRKTTVILSDLRHEANTDDVYGRIAALLRSTKVSRFIGVGPELTAARGLFGPNARCFPSTARMLEHLSTSDFSDEVILLKGAPEYGFERVFEMLEARKHETVLEVNLDAVVKNYNYFRSCLPADCGLIAMVKASGYGAGSYEIAKTLQAQGAAYLAVAVLDEGIELRRSGITMPIIVMNPKVVNYRSMFAYRLEPEIYSLEMLRDVVREASKNGVVDYPVHIKLDTGMHRMGFIEEELPVVMDTIEDQHNITIRSAFTHLATADCLDMDDYTLLQLDRFDRYTAYMQSRCGHRILRHALNSAGILRFPQYHYDMARLGIGLYGLNTLPADVERPLDNVSTLRTVIIALRHWGAGESIGYGRRGRLKRDSVIATIPIGYADGMNRHFGNGAITVLVNGREAPTIGNICMDACMIDVTGIECAVGDIVEVFGPRMPVQRLADVLGTIPYEIVTSVSPRVKRVYYRE